MAPTARARERSPRGHDNLLSARKHQSPDVVQIARHDLCVPRDCKLHDRRIDDIGRLRPFEQCTRAMRLSTGVKCAGAATALRCGGGTQGRVGRDARTRPILPQSAIRSRRRALVVGGCRGMQPQPSTVSSGSGGTKCRGKLAAILWRYGRLVGRLESGLRFWVGLGLGV